MQQHVRLGLGRQIGQSLLISENDREAVGQSEVVQHGGGGGLQFVGHQRHSTVRGGEGVQALHHAGKQCGSRRQMTGIDLQHAVDDGLELRRRRRPAPGRQRPAHQHSQAVSDHRTDIGFLKGREVLGAHQLSHRKRDVGYRVD